METTVIPQSLNETAAIARIVPLSPEDKVSLEKQKKILTVTFIGIMSCVMGFAGYQLLFQDLPLHLALLISGPSVVVMFIFLRLILKKTNESIHHAVKHVGNARVISKGRTSSSYWLVLDGPFNHMKRIFVSAKVYSSAQTNDLVYVEVVPTSKTLLSLKKQL